MEAIYSELPQHSCLSQLSGLFALRFRRVMKHMLTRWMHGYYIEAIRRWRAFLAADYSARRVEAAILVQKTRRGHLARRRAETSIPARCTAEQMRFEEMMEVRRRWLQQTYNAFGVVIETELARF